MHWRQRARLSAAASRLSEKAAHAADEQLAAERSAREKAEQDAAIALEELTKARRPEPDDKVETGATESAKPPAPGKAATDTDAVTSGNGQAKQVQHSSKPNTIHKRRAGAQKNWLLEIWN